MLAFRFGVSRGASGHSHPAPLRILALAFLIDDIKNRVPYLLRHDAIASDVFHLKPIRRRLCHSVIALIHLWNSGQFYVIVRTLPAREHRLLAQVVIWP